LGNLPPPLPKVGNRWTNNNNNEAFIIKVDNRNFVQEAKMNETVHTCIYIMEYLNS